jgi:hypothetical protein
VIDDHKPVLASSSFFSVDNNPWGKPFSAVTLNVIPTSANQSMVIVSYPRKQSGKARRYVAPIFTKKGHRRLLALSNILVDRAENFFMLPSHVDGWDANKRKAVENAFVNTVIGSHPARPTTNLMLF